MHKLNELFSVYINMSARTAPRTQTKHSVIQNMHKVNNLLIWAYKQNVIDEMRQRKKCGTNNNNHNNDQFR